MFSSNGKHISPIRTPVGRSTCTCLNINRELCLSATKMPETKKRSLDTMETSECATEPHAENENEKVNDFQIRDTCIMNGIANIQNILANIMLRLDGKDLHIDDLTKEIRAKKRYKWWTRKCARADKWYIIHNYWGARKSKKQKTKRWRGKLTRLKDFIVRLESQVNSHNFRLKSKNNWKKIIMLLLTV